MRKDEMSDDLQDFAAETIRRAMTTLSLYDLSMVHVALLAAAAGGAVEGDMDRAAFLEQASAFYDEYIAARGNSRQFGIERILQ